MAPNSTLIRDYSTFGDLTQRDVYHRHSTQTIKEGAVENFFYHIDSANVAVSTAVEMVSYDASSNVSTYAVYTKPASGNVDLSANASMLQITTEKTSVRSTLFEATGDASFGNLAVSGDSSLNSLQTTGAASLNSLDVTGATSLSDFTASGNASVGGTLDVTGATSLSTLDTSGLATMNSATVTGDTSLNTVTASGDASIGGTLGVTGDTSLSNVSASGDAAITGTLDVTGASTLTTLDTSGLATMNSATVTGDTSLNTLTTSGDASIGGTLAVTGDTSLSNVAASGTLTVAGDTSLANTTIDLGTGGTFAVTGNGSIDLGDSDLSSSGNVSFTGLTTIANLSLTGSSGFSGDLDMSNNNVLNVATLTRDNVRVSLDNTARTIDLQTWTGSAWDSSVTVAQESVSVFKPLSANSTLSVAGNLTCNGSAVNFGTVEGATNLTVFGNLEIKGTTTNTRIESNVVQIGDKNIELGFLEVDDLVNLDGAGITIGGEGGTINTRPELVYNSTLEAWQPNIDLVTKGPNATDIARMYTDGYFRSSTVANANIFTQVDSTSVNFGDKWRFHHDVANDTVELQHYEVDAWVPKFTYTA
jgi:hypothetical protein